MLTKTKKILILDDSISDPLISNLANLSISLITGLEPANEEALLRETSHQGDVPRARHTFVCLKFLECGRSPNVNDALRAAQAKKGLLSGKLWEI